VTEEDKDIWDYTKQIVTGTRTLFESSAADLCYVKPNGKFIKECGRGLFQGVVPNLDRINCNGNGGYLTLTGKRRKCIKIFVCRNRGDNVISKLGV